MRFGMCFSMHDATQAPSNCDFVELPLTGIAGLSSLEWNEARKWLHDAPPCAAVNVFFPSDYRLTGENADHARALEYAKLALPRAAQVGAQVAILGSGAARSAPLLFPIARAEEQFADLLFMIGEIAAEVGMKIAIEPLNRRETNVAYTLPDASRIALAVDSPHVGTMVDAFHFRLGNEHADGIVSAYSLLHVHYATVLGRGIPLDAQEEADAPAFFAALKARGYDGCLSIEAGEGNARIGLNVLRDMAGRFMG